MTKITPLQQEILIVGEKKKIISIEGGAIVNSYDLTDKEFLDIVEYMKTNRYFVMIEAVRIESELNKIIDMKKDLKINKKVNVMWGIPLIIAMVSVAIVIVTTLPQQWANGALFTWGWWCGLIWIYVFPTKYKSK